MNPFHVHPELVLSSVRHLTVLTIEADFQVNRFLMTMYMHYSFKRFVALRALVTAFIGVTFEMSPQELHAERYKI